MVEPFGPTEPIGWQGKAPMDGKIPEKYNSRAAVSSLDPQTLNS